MAVSTMVSGPSSGAMRRATSAMAGALMATTTRSCTPSSAGSALARTGAFSTWPPWSSRKPWVCRASSVAPRATALSAQPASASRVPIQPPMAPAP